MRAESELQVKAELALGPPARVEVLELSEILYYTLSEA